MGKLSPLIMFEFSKMSLRIYFVRQKSWAANSSSALNCFTTLSAVEANKTSQKSGFNLPSLKFSYLLLGMVKPTKAKARKCNVIGYGLFAQHAQSVLPIKSGMNWALEKNVMVIGHGQYTFFRSIRRFCFQQHIQYWTSSQVGAKRGAFKAVSLQGSLGVKLMAFWRRVHWVVWVLYASTQHSKTSKLLHF